MATTTGGEGSRSRGVLAWTLSLAVVLGCASAGVDRPVSPGLSREVRDYLRSPLDGFGEALSPEWQAGLLGAFRALVDDGSLAGAAATADELLRRSPGLAPAVVLAAQISFVRGDHRAVVERLTDLGEERPDYRALQLVLGRAAELLGEPALAYRSYLAAEGDTTADRRARATAEAAAQSVLGQLVEAIERGHLPEAQRLSEELSSWASESRLTLEGAWRVAAASSPVEELEAIRPLAAASEGDRAVIERLAELELEVGDPKLGVDLYEDLNRRYPGEPELVDRLAAAKFRWRLEMLPSEVLSLIGNKELTRGDFATLLYWMIPGARTARGGSGTIATDVPLRHPQREAILRVVNLGLLRVADETLRLFEPDRPITRGEAFGSLLGWLGNTVSCATGLARNPAPSTGAICDAASRCGLLRERAECLPGASLLGVEAREAIRRTLDLAGAP